MSAASSPSSGWPTAPKPPLTPSAGAWPDSSFLPCRTGASSHLETAASYDAVDRQARDAPRESSCAPRSLRMGWPTTGSSAGPGPAMNDGRSITDLVTRARNGDQRAWDGLVERYAPLVWSICHRYELSRADADDVHQSVWLQLVSQLDKIRDPVALPGWLATTT